MSFARLRRKLAQLQEIREIQIKLAASFEPGSVSAKNSAGRLAATEQDIRSVLSQIEMLKTQGNK